MKIVSYWKGPKGEKTPQQVYDDDEGLVLIMGYYNHKNQGKDEKALGIHWKDFPQSHGVLSPCRIPQKTALAILAGLLHQAIEQNYSKKIKNSIIEAIEFLS